MVLYQGNSFTSRQYVPIGVDIDNEEYWAETGNFNAQVEEYRRTVLSYKAQVEEYESGTEAKLLKKAFNATDFSSMLSIDAPVGSTIMTGGYYAAGDGGEATYIVIEAPDNPTYRDVELNNGNYARNTSEIINVNQYGILGDGADKPGYWTKLQQLVESTLVPFEDYTQGIKAYKHFFFPAGTYYIYEALHFDGYTEVSGEGHIGFSLTFEDEGEPTIFRLENTSSCLLFSGYTPEGNVITTQTFDSFTPAHPTYAAYNCASCPNIQLHDFTVMRDLNGSNRPECGIMLKHCTNSTIRDISIYGPEVGLQLEAGWTSVIDNVFSLARCEPICIYGSNASVTVRNCYLTSNRNHTINGLSLYGVDKPWLDHFANDAPTCGLVINGHKIEVYDTTIENAQYGIGIINCPQQTIENCHFEQVSRALLYAAIDSTNYPDTAPNRQCIDFNTPSYWVNTNDISDLHLADINNVTDLHIREARMQAGTKLVKNNGTGNVYLDDFTYVWAEEGSMAFANNTYKKSESRGVAFYQNVNVTSGTAITIPLHLQQNRNYLVSFSGATDGSSYLGVVFVNWWTVASSVVTKLAGTTNFTVEVVVDEDDGNARKLKVTPAFTGNNYNFTVYAL